MVDADTKSRLFVYFAFLLHGIGILVPWNSFINAFAYYTEFKLANTEYATYYIQAMGIAANIPTVTFNWLNIFVNIGGSVSNRILLSILVDIVMILMTVILAMVDTSGWVAVFFSITIITVFIVNMATGIYQNTIFGLASIFPIEYVGAVVLGNNLSGLILAILNTCSSLIFPSLTTSSIYFFIFGIIVLMLCFDAFYALPLNNFFAARMKEKQITDAAQAVTNERVPYWTIFKQVFPQCLNVFLVFFVTLSVFPAIQAGIRRSDKDFFIKDPRLYLNIMCFIVFNLFAMIGSLVTRWVRWPSPKLLIFPVTVRLLYIPLFLLCNYHPVGKTRIWPVLIDSDWLYLFLGVTMAFTSGYFSSMAMMYAPQVVDDGFQFKAGMFACAMLVSGILCGLILATSFPSIVS